MDLQRRHRRTLRLRDFDYTQAGAYFVTICTQDRSCLFGEVLDAQMHLNEAGSMIQEVWDGLSAHYPGVETDAVVVMPNHLHGIIVLLGGTSGAESWPDHPKSMQASPRLGDVVHRLKSLTTRRFADGVRNLGWPAFAGRLWQRNYFEHVVRDRGSLDQIREYIAANPAHWITDSENPEHMPRS